MFDVRNIFEDPSLALSFLEFAPLIGGEEAITVRDMEILAEQTNHLGFGPERKVPNYKLGRFILSLHLMPLV